MIPITLGFFPSLIWCRIYGGCDITRGLPQKKFPWYKARNSSEGNCKKRGSAKQISIARRRKATQSLPVTVRWLSHGRRPATQRHRTVQFISQQSRKWGYRGVWGKKSLVRRWFGNVKQKVGWVWASCSFVPPGGEGKEGNGTESRIGQVYCMALWCDQRWRRLSGRATVQR